MSVSIMVIEIELLFMLNSLPLIFGSGYDAFSNEGDANDYLHVSYNCSNPNPYIIRDNNCSTQILLELCDCDYVPTGLFNYPNNMQKLVFAAPHSMAKVIKRFVRGIFEGLEKLQELELRGFENIWLIEDGVLWPLRNLNCIYLNLFGQKDFSLSLNEIGTMLQDLSDTPLEKIVMNGVRTLEHRDKSLNIDVVFNIRNVKITSLIIENSYITILTGSFTKTLPHLSTLSLSLFMTYELGLESALDAAFLPNLHFFQIYNNHDQMLATFNLFEFTLWHLLIKVLGTNVDDFYATFFDARCSLMVKIKITESLNTLVLNRIRMSNFTGNPPSHDYNPICIDVSNQLHSVDLSGCQLEEELRLVTGLKLLSFVNVQNTKISRFSPRQLAELPRLEYFLLGHNNLRDCIKSDYDSNLFKSGKGLISLDLAYCNLVDIPYYEFSSLVFLKVLNLSGNVITNVNFSLANLAQLQLLNLSNNKIERLSTHFTKMLGTHLERHPNASLLEIDLSDNILSCLCNATDFINWIQSPSIVTFTRLHSYTCLYPNGSWVKLTSVDNNELKHQCKILDTFANNTDCSCDDNELENFYNIRYALAEYRCKHSDGRLIEMKTLDLNTTINSCSHQKQTRSIIFSVLAVMGILVIIIVVIVIVGTIRYKSKKPEDLRHVLELFDDGKLIGALMALLFENRSSNTTTVHPYDVFIVYHDSNRRQLNQEIINNLVGMEVKVVTEEDILLGISRLEGVLESISQCRSIMLVLSPDFVEDDWCREVTIRASVRQHAVVPLIFIPLHLDENEVIFNGLINTCRPIYWNFDIEKQDRILRELKARILNEAHAQAFEILESAESNLS